MDELKQMLTMVMAAVKEMDEDGTLNEGIHLLSGLMWRFYGALVEKGFTPDQAISIMSKMKSPISAGK
jgi:hypothetical protein